MKGGNNGDQYDLDNIIDACGVYFRTLILHTQYKKKLKEPWEAVPNKKLAPTLKSKKGQTAREAVSRLMEEINKYAQTKS